RFYLVILDLPLRYDRAVRDDQTGGKSSGGKLKYHRLTRYTPPSETTVDRISCDNVRKMKIVQSVCFLCG
uniref:Uncharacterized protein n=1 Tax=Anopheles atroparvus TaxID=41427 RepID=A0AAG5DHX4_ANOAO